jgi:ABC-type phosphate/phosphonate transport system ATPase subunit
VHVHVQGLTIDFPHRRVRALAEVDLEIQQGEQVALLGPSGSGKTTLLRALVGAVRPVTGRVRIGDLDPFGSDTEVRQLRRATGIMRQGDDLVLGLSARTNAAMATAPTWTPRDWLTLLRGGVPRQYAARLALLARRHGITDCLPAKIEQLSGGQRRRVALVRALLPGPRLLLADEPTTGLDPPAAAAAVNALRSADAATLIVTTHDLTVARQFPRIVALQAGRVVHDGSEVGAAAVARIYGRDAG